MKIKTCSAYLTALVFLFGFAALSRLAGTCKRDAIGCRLTGHEFLTITPSGINLPPVRSVRI
jgi:hypothetical protein